MNDGNPISKKHVFLQLALGSTRFLEVILLDGYKMNLAIKSGESKAVGNKKGRKTFLLKAYVVI